jgi:hypothetical protein
MLPRTDINGSSRPLASIDAPAPVASSTDARQEIYHRLTQIAIGKTLQAEVLSLLDDGTYLVKIADTTARMNLPVGTRVGDSIPMMLVAKEPRPTFLLLPPASIAPASLSATGRLIDNILQSARQEGASATVVGNAPLLPSSAAVDTKQIAAALQDSVAFSGLFYESHMQEWVNGRRPLTALVREPQAQLENTPSKTPQNLPRTDAGSTELTQLARNMRELANAIPSLMDLIREAQTANGAMTDVLTIAQPQTVVTVEPEAARLINQQLATLEQQRVAWQGELWPGQPMEWEVSEDPPEKDGEPAAQSSWTSTVRFQLPTLGQISATIRLTGDRVHIQASTASEAAASSLRAHGSELADALAAVGSPLDSLTVKRDEPA